MERDRNRRMKRREEIGTGLEENGGKDEKKGVAKG